MKKFLSKFAGTLILLFVFGNQLFSQGQSTTQGKDFWLSYGQNYTQAVSGNMLQLRVVATKPTKVTLTFTQDGTTETFSVAAGQVYTRTFDAVEAAKVYNNNASTGVSNKSLHITSNELVSVFAINILAHTTDATNVLPVNNYGQSYRHISYKSVSGIGDGYTLIASEDNTNVKENGAVVTTLNKGQVYSKYTSVGDMTGTLITSDKPIAYFTTNTCVQVPNGTTACDCLFQQQAPIHSWGNKFLIPVTKRGIERVRIVASQDGTTVSQTGGTVISGVGTGSLTLNAGQFVELQVSLSGGGCYVVSDKPVAVASFLTGLNFPGLTYKNGDPAMAWVPPVEQTVMNVALAPFVATGTSVLKEHYALIVTPTATKDATTMTIGSNAPQALSGGTWTDNAASGYSFYSLQMTQETATYYFENAAGLSVMGYGLGNYESYFYLAASSSRQLNPAFYLNEIHFEDANGQTYCAGEFNVRGVAQMQLAPGSESLKWFIDGVEQEAARGKLEWIISSLKLNTPHTITMSVKELYGQLFTLTTTITVVDPQPLKITGNRYICPPATSTVLTADAGPSRYQWYKNGQAILGATKNTYTVTSAEAGNYTVIGHYGTCVSPMSETTTVVAGCEPILKVTYDGNGNTGGTIPTDADLYPKNAEVTVKAKGDLVRTGTTFLGWSFAKKDLITAEADEPTDLKNANSKFNITADTTLYAVWAIDVKGPNGGGDGIPDYLQKFVTYDGNENTDGTPPTDPNAYHGNNKEVTVKAKGDLVRTGATFLGWSFAKKDLITAKADEPADLMKAGDKFYITADTTLYAVWAKDTNGPNGGSDGIPDYLQRFVTYDGNGHTGGTAPTDANAYANNAEVTLKAHGDLVRTGATFIGWSFAKKDVINAEADEPADLMKAGDKFNITADTTLYAVWAKDVKGPNGGSDGIPDYLQRFVTYDGNGSTGGTLPKDITSYANNDEVTVKDKGDLARTQAVFLGWSFAKKDVINAEADIPANLMKAGDKFNITADTTLYAVWAKDTNGPNGGSDGIPDYLQKGVTYDGNGHTGGTVPTDANLYNDNDQVTVKGPGNLVRANAIFIGWSFVQKPLVTSESDVPTDLKVENDKFIITSGITLYAVWAKDANGPNGGSDGIPDYLQKGVNYDGNGNTGGTAPTDANLYNNNDQVTVKAKGDLIRTNAMFLGWSFGQKSLITSEGDEPADLMKAGDKFNITANTTLYAVWAKDANGNGIPDYIEIRITWHRGAMPGASKTETVAKGMIKFKDQGFTARNYVFVGWCESKTPVLRSQAMEKIVMKLPTFHVPGSSADIQTDKTFYAVWAIDRNNDGTPDYGGFLLNSESNRIGLRVLSDEARFSVSDDTSTPITDIRVWTYANTLYIESDRTVRADIYTSGGILIKQIELTQGLTSEPMNAGMYIVVIGRERFKVFVK